MQFKDIIEFPSFYNKQIKDRQLPIKISYRFSRINTSIAQEMEFYRSHLQQILDKYAIKDSDGKPELTEDGRGVKLSPGTELDCEKEISELLDTEIDLPEIKFTIDELSNAKLTLSPEDIKLLMPFLTE